MRSLHGKCPSIQSLEKGFRLTDTLRILVIEQQQHMKIAVSRMADDRGEKSVRLDVGLGLGHTFGKTRDRNADIGRKRRQFRRQRPACQ